MVMLRYVFQLLLLPFVIGCPDRKNASKPNIIFILADDLGWNDVGFHGETEIPTPNLDALASDGIILNNYYVLPLCSPSRSALFTGMYPANVGLQNQIIDNAGAWALPLRFKIMPAYFKDLGYKTRMVGKWHLGFYKEEYTPLMRGFDSHYGFWGSNVDHFQHTGYAVRPASTFQEVPEERQNQTISFVGHDFRDDRKSDASQQGRYLADVFTERVEKILQSHNKQQPLFLTLTHHSVHRGGLYTPIRAPCQYVRGFEFIKNHTRRNFAGAVTALDVSIGRIFETLQKTGLLKNSIVVFSTDNGADFATFSSNAGSNWPLRGQKITNWEGGVRGVGLIWSPLLRKNRRISDQMMHITDWLPTLYRAAGGNTSTLPSQLDGINMWDALTDDLPSPRNLTLINVDPIWKMGAVRLGDFKIVTGTYPNQNLDGWYGPTAREATAPRGFRSESKVLEALRRFYKNQTLQLRKPVVEVECGQRSSDPSSTCNPVKAPCLFNIRRDPCEFNNIAEQNPEITRTLIDLLQKFNETSARPLNQPLSYMADPLLHGGVWTSYLDQKVDTTCKM